MWHIIYNFLLGILWFPVGIFLFARNVSRGMREYPVIRERIKADPPLKPRSAGKRLLVWCASVGEVRTAIPLMNYLKSYGLVVAVGTATGYQQAQKLFSDFADVSVVYSPLDFPTCVSRFLARIAPDAVLIIETEIWPNLIWTARRRKIPLLLINGRFSRRSQRIFRLFAPLMSELLNSFSLLSLRSESDRNNLSALAVKVPVEINGNMKYDLTAGVDVGGALNRRREIFASDEMVIVAGSIRPGEEKIIIRAYQEAARRVEQKVKLVLAPRHREMIPEVGKCLTENNLSFVRWSQIDRQKPVSADCLVIDTVGELFNLYGLAQVAIVGGSFLDYGGQNPLEPAAWGCPVVFGKYMDNFSEEALYLRQSGGAFMAVDFSELADDLILLLSDREKRALTGENARKTKEKFSGAAQRNAGRIRELIK
jgi:3-deoxy-D-manno-octulosonic-acid transferase